MSSDKLSFELQDGWRHPDVFDYSGDGVCPVRKIPGSSNDAELYVLNDWKSVVNALKSPSLRSLRQVEPDKAVSGVTLQHEEGLLRRDPPDTDIRRVINPFFSARAIEEWRSEMRNCAIKHATRIRDIAGVFDLNGEYCRPFIHDVVSIATGVPHGDFEKLSDLSDRTTGQLVTRPEDHEKIVQAWLELYDFVDEQIARIREDRKAGRDAVSLTAKVVNQLDEGGLPENEVLRAVTTIYNGFPTVVPAVAVSAHQLLVHREHVEQHKDDPDLWPKVVKELLRHRAHFSFGLPGKVLSDTKIGNTLIPAGATVLPSIHAAQYDPAKTRNPEEFDISRNNATLVVFGMGVHVCPGRAFALVLLEEGLRVLLDVNKEIELVVSPYDVEWMAGTMPSPKSIPVRIHRD